MCHANGAVGELCRSLALRARRRNPRSRQRERRRSGTEITHYRTGTGGMT